MLVDVTGQKGEGPGGLGGSGQGDPGSQWSGWSRHNVCAGLLGRIQAYFVFLYGGSMLHIFYFGN